MSEKEPWIKTEEQLPVRPKGDDSYHLYCYVVIDGKIEELPWNYEHNCWDDESGDDFKYEAEQASHWMPQPPLPKLPKELRKD